LTDSLKNNPADSTPGQNCVELISKVFDQGADHAVVLMRHSAREYAEGVHDLENPLTEEGRSLCRGFCDALPSALTVRGYASPAQRCLETAELIMSAHEDKGGAAGRHRPVEGLGVFYALDQMKMWKGMRQAGGLVEYLQMWFDGQIPEDAMMPPDLAARLVFRVLADKLKAPIAERQLDLCVSHDMTVHLVRDRLLGESVAMAEVAYLDGLVVFYRDGELMMQSHHGDAMRIAPDILLTTAH
jgi:broad specificity phosphatase PhoE